ncbi:dihydrofolate reductase family protein [Micromonospora peucetia]|uniref:Dihydrofolate reductase family protein n=1 Tax=Micromonospora peucetia TaxID=47871 RepID=A0ABZ1ECC4_9ACTN|nr:dihydrofolate reductase family protein [Micromonospora peucetia]WSA31241.1 dihydrofolate reductase family protein [Micromonospora peucetia]
MRSRVRVNNFSVSLDGYGAGPRQSLDNPLGVGGQLLHDWLFAARGGQALIGHDDGEDGLDNRFFQAGEDGLGATIMGRNMFGPSRGPWPADPWNGWWGQDPPFHHPVFVLTNHARPPLRLAGGTTFHFVQDGIHAALELAREAAGKRAIRIGGGVHTIRQYLRAGLIDELHLALVPVLLGDGERLFASGSPGGGLSGYDCVEFVASPAVVHLRLRRAPVPAARPR